jgi:hypothetical protein
MSGFCPPGQRYDPILQACVDRFPGSGDFYEGPGEGDVKPGPGITNPTFPVPTTPPAPPPTPGGKIRPTIFLPPTQRTVTPQYRFFTPDWANYLATGAHKGPDPTDGFLGLLQNSIFKQQLEKYQTQTGQGVPVLGLGNGGAAFGYIDPAWSQFAAAGQQTAQPVAPVTSAIAPVLKAPTLLGTPDPYTPGTNRPQPPPSQSLLPILQAGLIKRRQPVYA